jgi:hypothetical protein
MPRSKKPPSKKNSKPTKEKPASAVDIISIAQSLGATSGFVADEHFPMGELQRIVRSRFPDIAQEELANLLNSTAAAVTQLSWDRKQPNKKMVATKYSAVLSSAGHLANALSDVLGDSSTGGPFLDLIAPNLKPEQIERLYRIRDHIISDLFWLQSVAGRKIKTMNGMRTRKDFEFNCAVQIALAWLAATGEPPTLTRNKDAVSGPQLTSFQRFMSAAVTPAIGDAIVRNAIAELGDIATQSSLSEIPKGITGA